MTAGSFGAVLGTAAPAGTVEGDVQSVLEDILDRALRSHPQIQHVVLASPQGLVIGFKSRMRMKAIALSALAPLLSDAGETVFREMALAPLREVMLVGPRGVAFQIRCEHAPCFVLLSAVGEANLGLLRLVASEIEGEVGVVLKDFLR